MKNSRKNQLAECVTDKRTQSTKPARPGSQREKLESVGIVDICQRIGAGETQRELAESLQVHLAELNGWLARPENAERSARAKAESAEAWLDIGYRALLDAASDPAEIQRAKAIEQHCARRAAIRDPKRYGDKLNLDHIVVVSPLAEAFARMTANGSAIPIRTRRVIDGEARLVGD
jgi:hypothetical protein